MHPTSGAHETEKEKKKKREGHVMGLEKSLGRGKKESGPTAEKKKKREGVGRAEKERGERIGFAIFETRQTIFKSISNSKNSNSI